MNKNIVETGIKNIQDNIDNLKKIVDDSHYLNGIPRSHSAIMLEYYLDKLQKKKTDLAIDKLNTFLNDVDVVGRKTIIKESCGDDKRIQNNDLTTQNKIINNLGNSTIGSIYYHFLTMYEKILKGIRDKITVPGHILVTKANNTNLCGGAAAGAGNANDDLKENWNSIAKSLGVIYGSFMKLLNDSIGGEGDAQEKSKKIQSFVFDTTYDIVSSATSGGTHALTHAIGQIPPLGIIFSLMELIKTAVIVGTKSIGGGMIALDPIMEIFGKVIGSNKTGDGNYKDLLTHIRQILDALNLVSSGLEQSAYVEEDCNVENNGSGSGSGDGSD